MKVCITKIIKDYKLGVVTTLVGLFVCYGIAHMQLNTNSLSFLHTTASSSKPSYKSYTHLSSVAEVNSIEELQVYSPQRVKKSSYKSYFKFYKPDPLSPSTLNKLCNSFRYFFVSSTYFNYLYLLYCILII